jgi:hypothetical protein
VIWAVQSPFQKYWRFSPKQITSLVAPSRPNEGRLAIVTNAGRDAVDAVGAFDEWRRRGRRSRVVLTPRRWRQVCGRNSACDGDKKARSPGRARRKPLKPLRAGMPGCSGELVVTTSCAHFHFARETAGALGARHSPRPLSLGETFMHHSGASRGEKAEACVRSTGWLHLAPLAGRGPRRSAAEDRGEGDYPQLRACREPPHPLATCSRPLPASGAR